MKVKKKTLKKKNIIIVLVLVLIALITTWFFTRDTFPEELLAVDMDSKQHGTYTVDTSEEEGIYQAIHYPIFEDSNVETWNLKLRNEILNTELVPDTKTYKLDYKSIKELDTFTSVSYTLFMDDKEVTNLNRTWWSDHELTNLSELINKLGLTTLQAKYPNLNLNSSDIYVLDSTFYIDGTPITLEEMSPYLNVAIGGYPAVEYKDPEDKYVAITLDDGPHWENTEKALEVLKKYNANATFFMLGSNVENYPEIVKAVYDSGNQVGNHSYNHPNLANLPIEEAKNQIDRTNTLIRNITGQEGPIMVRPPYGAFNDTTALDTNSIFINWNVDTMDWKHKDPKKVCDSIGNSEDGDIILLHDIHKGSVDSLDCALDKLTDRGFKVVSVEELMLIRNYDFEIGKTYYSLPYKE